MVDLNAHEAGNGGQSQGKPTTRGVLLYSECEGPPLTVACEVSICWPGLHPPAKSVSNEKRILFSCREREAVTLNIGRFISTKRARRATQILQPRCMSIFTMQGARGARPERTCHLL